MGELMRRLVALVRRRRMERELDEELQFHLDERRDALVRDGAPPDVAIAGARRALGGSLRLHEAARDVWALASLDAVLRDARYALRTLRGASTFTVAATVTLALAIGASTAIFSLIEGVLLRPLPYAEPDRLVVVDEGGIGMPGVFAVLRRDSATLDYAGYEARETNLTGFGAAQRLRTAVVSGELFSVLGLSPQLGRTFRRTDEGPGRARVVIVSDGFWRRTLGGARDAIGRHLTLDARSYEIVGVMPRGVLLPAPDTALWMPLDLDPSDIGAFWGRGALTLIGRVRPSATREAALAELRAAIPRIRVMFPWRMPDAWGAQIGLAPWRDALVGSVRLTLAVLFAAAALVWVVACANVANLMLARGAARSHEMALRGALGASRAQLVRQLLIESLMLALLGGAAGGLIVALGVPALAAFLPPDTPRLAEVSMNVRVLAFGLVTTLLTALAFGLAPAWRSSRPGRETTIVADRTATAGRARRRRAEWLVAAQVATAVVVVVGASLLLRSLWRLSAVPVGFDVSRLVTAQITPNVSACPSASRCVAFYEEVMQRTRAHAGVGDAAVISTLPLSGEIPGVAVSIDDHPRQPGEPDFVLWASAISPRYFQTMGIPLVRGRAFTDADRDGALPVAIISAATARRFWPGADPIGRRVKPMSSRHWRTIIGVAADVTDYALAGHVEWIDGTVYFPYGQSEGRGRAPWPMTLVARSDIDAGLARDLPAIVAAASREAPVSRVQSMSGVVSASLAAPRALAWLLVLFAGLALTLGAVGIAGVIAYVVAERTREIGIRVALGGRPADILAMTLGETLTRAGAGLIAGVAVSVIGARAIERLLFETTARDPGALVATVTVVSVVALMAALVPARRALRVNPVDALRVE